MFLWFGSATPEGAWWQGLAGKVRRTWSLVGNRPRTIRSVGCFVPCPASVMAFQSRSGSTASRSRESDDQPHQDLSDPSPLRPGDRGGSRLYLLHRACSRRGARVRDEGGHGGSGRHAVGLAAQEGQDG